MTTPPTTPAGAPPPPAQTTTTPEVATLASVVDALKPMFGAQAPNINTWETRCLVERLLNEKKSVGPLQGADATAKALLDRAVGGWDNPAVKSGLYLRTACAVLGITPVPAAAGTTQKLLPASLPGSAQEKEAQPSPDDKEVRNLLAQVAHLETATKRARRLAVVALFVALIGSALGLITKLVGWIATSPSWVVAILTAVVAFGIGVSASGRVADWFKKRH